MEKVKFLLLGFVAAALVSVPSLGHGEIPRAQEKPPRAIAPAPNLTTVDNGVVRVGVDGNRGGSITYFSGPSCL